MPVDSSTDLLAHCNFFTMNTPEPAPKPEGTPVSPCLIKWLSWHHKEVIPLIQQRCEYGMAKYGQPLMTADGRDEVIDALQEVGDLLQYVYKAKLNGRLPQAREALSPALKALFVLLN